MYTPERKTTHIRQHTIETMQTILLPKLKVLEPNNLYINSGRWYLCHVSSTFATVNTHANVFFVFLPGGISKEWRHIVSANCHFDRQSFRAKASLGRGEGCTFPLPLWSRLAAIVTVYPVSQDKRKITAQCTAQTSYPE